MLEVVLTRATLSARERETLEGMWDAAHRYGGLSRKQTSWIEDIYYKIPKQDPKVPHQRVKRKGSVNSSSVKMPQVVRTFERFKLICPDASPTVLQRVEAFFKSGGEILRVLPASDPPKASKA